MKTISLVITSWDGYWDRLGIKISDNINNFNTQPDEIVFASDKEIDTSSLKCKNIKVIVLPKETQERKNSLYKNEAIKHVTSDWVVFLDLDDIQYPNYLDNLDDNSDIHAFSFSYKGSLNFPSQDSLYKRFKNAFDSSTIPGTSAVKKEVFNRLKFESNCHEDHILYACSYKLNLKMSCDNMVRFEYTDYHGWNLKEVNRITQIYLDVLQGKRIIYCYWDSKYTFTENRKKCLESMEKNSKVDIVIIDDDVFYNLENKEIPIHKGFKYLSSVGKSDYVRAYMMYFYGQGYSDIKQCNFDWNLYFEKLFLSTNDCIGYTSKNFYEIGDFWKEDRNILKNIKSEYQKFIGMGYFIFKPKTNLALVWLLDIHKKMDEKYEQLEKNPGNHPYIVPGGVHSSYSGDLQVESISKEYPFGWAEIGGICLHKAQYQLGLKGFIGEMPYVDMNNYR